MRETLRRHRQTLLAAIGLLAPACARDPVDAMVRDAGRDTGTPGDPDTGLDSSTAPDVAVAADGGASDSGERDGSESRDGSIPPGECEHAEPILQVDGAPTGFVRCEGGRILRVASATCSDPAPEGRACEVTMEGNCAVDADCAERPHGRCILPRYDDRCHCAYGCAADSDCPAGTTCACGGGEDPQEYPTQSECVRARCITGSDCASGVCQTGAYDDGCSISYWTACAEPGDGCRSDTDCPGSDCTLIDDGRQVWACYVPHDCGRPFRVAGMARVAAVLRGDSLGAPAQVAAAAHWLDMARLEHASVASFARFTLDLMQHGAPPELLAGAARAMADEVDHARRCFALASRFAGVALSAGPLVTAGALEPTSLAALTLETVRDACVGETLGAAEAAWLAGEATDPEVREALQVIAEDELRHAALGWQTLRWALDQPGAPSRSEVRAVMETTLGDLTRPRAPVAGGADLRAVGVPDPAARAALFGRVAREVIGPVAEALLEG